MRLGLWALRVLGMQTERMRLTAMVRFALSGQLETAKRAVRLPVGCRCQCSHPAGRGCWCLGRSGCRACLGRLCSTGHALHSHVQEVLALRARGMVRGGTIGAALIAYGHDWYELDAVRFYSSEPARHKVVDLTVRELDYHFCQPSRCGELGCGSGAMVQKAGAALGSWCAGIGQAMHTHRLTCQGACSGCELLQ